MNIGIVSKSESYYSTIRLMDEIRKTGHTFTIIKHPEISLYLDNDKVKIFKQSSELHIKRLNGIIARLGSNECGFPITLLRQFQILDIPVINTPEAILSCSDKYETLQKLQKAKVPIPKTFYSSPGNTESFEASAKMLGNKKTILVKLMTESGGTGISRITPKAIPDVVETVWETGERVHLQEFVKFATVNGRGRDIRTILIGGKIIGAYQRIAAKGRFKANIHQGGEPKAYKLTAEQKEIALKAANAVGADIAGVDILSSKDRKANIVIEVNTSPGFEGFEMGTGINIAKRIVKYCISKFDKK